MNDPRPSNRLGDSGNFRCHCPPQVHTHGQGSGNTHLLMGSRLGALERHKLQQVAGSRVQISFQAAAIFQGAPGGGAHDYAQHCRWTRRSGILPRRHGARLSNLHRTTWRQGVVRNVVPRSGRSNTVPLLRFEMQHHSCAT